MERKLIKDDARHESPFIYKRLLKFSVNPFDSERAFFVKGYSRLMFASIAFYHLKSFILLPFLLLSGIDSLHSILLTSLLEMVLYLNISEPKHHDAVRFIYLNIVLKLPFLHYIRRRQIRNRWNSGDEIHSLLDYMQYSYEYVSMLDGKVLLYRRDFGNDKVQKTEKNRVVMTMYEVVTLGLYNHSMMMRKESDNFLSSRDPHVPTEKEKYLFEAHERGDL